jgi:hypothetical protein
MQAGMVSICFPKSFSTVSDILRHHKPENKQFMSENALHMWHFVCLSMSLRFTRCSHEAIQPTRPDRFRRRCRCCLQR